MANEWSAVYKYALVESACGRLQNPSSTRVACTSFCFQHIIRRDQLAVCSTSMLNSKHIHAHTACRSSFVFQFMSDNAFLSQQLCLTGTAIEGCSSTSLVKIARSACSWRALTTSWKACMMKLYGSSLLIMTSKTRSANCPCGPKLFVPVITLSVPVMPLSVKSMVLSVPVMISSIPGMIFSVPMIIFCPCDLDAPQEKASHFV